jgi:alanyl-tRNA synthetase
MDMVKTRKELIKEYIDFFKSKNHKEIANSSLIPENDPTVLFTTAGMHPLVPFLIGNPHHAGKRLVNVQRCIRTGDIDEVGDDVHLTFFEMLGNWSLGDYFKEEAIKMSFEFLTKILKIPKERIAVSCFAGDKNAPKDEESAKIWQSLGIPQERIVFLPKENNWWGPAGKIGPCGPDSEMFYYKGEKIPNRFNPEDKKWIEIWNDVFMQYNKTENGFEELKQKNVDTGMGTERVVALINELDDIYLSDCLFPLIKEIEKISKKKYGRDKEETKSMRIIADHIKAAVMIIGDGVVPGNKEQGYVLRRLIRRAINHGKKLIIQNNFTEKIAEKVMEIYDDYKHLQINREKILKELNKEETRFRETLASGLRFFNNILSKLKSKEINGKDAFLLYQSYGFPIELIEELGKEKGIKINIGEFEKEQEKHQELSRTATAGKFKSGLADNSEQTTKLHTATHLLNQALREILKKKDIFQKGSNITAERLRFDFNFDRKITENELKEIETLINKKIKEELEVKKQEMGVEEAKQYGAQGVFESKYGEKVSVYSIGNFSKEICAGPHVKNIKELGKFKIIKEESVAAGVRRIKAVLE